MRQDRMLQPFQTFGLLNSMDEFVRSGFGSELLRVDVKEDEKQYIIHADAPGVSKEDVNITFDKGVLNIEVSERKNTEVKEGEKVIRTERFFSKRSRSFSLGDKVDEHNIDADLKEGVLTITLPKKESAQIVKKIEIKWNMHNFNFDILWFK